MSYSTRKIPSLPRIEILSVFRLVFYVLLHFSSLKYILYLHFLCEKIAVYLIDYQRMQAYPVIQVKNYYPQVCHFILPPVILWKMNICHFINSFIL